MPEITPKYLKDDAACVLRAIKGEASAYQVLYNRYKHRLYGYIRLRISNREDAQEILTRTLIKAFTNLTKIKQPKNFKTWIFKIATNEIRTYQRNQTTNLNTTSIEHIPETLLTNDPKENSITQQVRETLNLLNPNELNLIDLRFYQKKTINEIAEFTNKKPEVIKYQLKKALNKFARFYQKKYKLELTKHQKEDNKFGHRKEGEKNEDA